NVEKVLQQASRFHQAAVRMTPLQLYKIKGKLFNRSVKVDCVIGGSGETTAKVKAYEAKKARKMGAKELTLVLAPSLILSCAYSEIRKEVKKIKRAAKKCAVKVWVDNKYAFSTIAALARVCSDAGIDYFCVPQFSGCERLRFDLFRNCSLEISDVENLADFKKMTGAGVRRIVTSHVSDIYLEWMKEVNDGEKPPLEEKEKPELKIV
ncbi:MAG: hypothetical protein J6A46_02720, partial [Clostridia bacterium]|nr:hypothetical protein [Clostridia bacterium]